MHFVFCNISSCCIHVFIFWWEAEHWGLPCYEYANKVEIKTIQRFSFSQNKKKHMKMQIKLKSKLFEVFLIQNTKTQIKLKSKPFKSFFYSEDKNTRLINYVLKCFYHKHTFHAEMQKAASMASMLVLCLLPNCADFWAVHAQHLCNC